MTSSSTTRAQSASATREHSGGGPPKIFAARLPLVSAVLLALCASAATDARAQFRVPPPREPSNVRPQTPATAPPVAEDESESEGDGRGEEVVRPRAADAATLMRTARAVLVRSHTAFVSDKEVEDSLRKRKEFRAWGLTLTRSDAEADLIVEIERKAFSRRFTFSVVEPRTMLVVTSGKTRSVLFGKKIPNKIAEKFVNRLKAVRPYPGD
jgi:hypothetical protein